MFASSANATTLNVNFMQLTGETGVTNQTGVFRADLSNLNFEINSLTVVDSNSGVGGAPGEFSGFDLDGIKLSTTLITDASQINNLPSLDVFDFSNNGTLFTPGQERKPLDAPLFGSLLGNINNSVATLESFDANSSPDNPFGFVSLGDGGKIGFNLKKPVQSNGSLYLYIGEAGNNGESASAHIVVSNTPVNVPEPANITALTLIAIYFRLRRSKNTDIVT
jgi:hypothetical protein